MKLLRKDINVFDNLTATTIFYFPYRLDYSLKTKVSSILKDKLLAYRLIIIL